MNNLSSMTSRLLAAALLASTPIAAQAEETGWYARAHGGLSSLSDTEGDFLSTQGASLLNADADNGGFAGIAGGYRYGNGWRAEAAWEYRNNELSADIDALDFPTADFASSIIYLNGIYAIEGTDRWQPYVGAGVAWAQEIDIDLERNGIEQSYSTDGDVGFQVFAGAEYALQDNWVLSGEVRYASLGSLDLEPEASAPGSLSGLDYDHTSIQLGISYRF